MSQPARSPRSDADAYGEADLEAAEPGVLESRTVYPPRRQRLDSDIHELTVPPGQRPSRQNLPGSIEEAVLAVLDQIPRIASVPPPAHDHDSGER